MLSYTRLVKIEHKETNVINAYLVTVIMATVMFMGIKVEIHTVNQYHDTTPFLNMKLKLSHKYR